MDARRRTGVVLAWLLKVRGGSQAGLALYNAVVTEGRTDALALNLVA